MSEPAILELARAISTGQAQQNWYFYTLILLLGFLASLGGGYIGGYAKRRGEQLATRADFRELKDQLAETTKVAEEVKAEVARKEWTAREQMTLRRQKLEELMHAVYATKAWHIPERANALFDGPDAGPDPLGRLEVLTALYFPELKGTTNEVVLAHTQLLQVIYRGAASKPGASADAETRKTFHEGLMKDWSPAQVKFSQATRKLEEAAGSVMSALTVDQSAS